MDTRRWPRISLWQLTSIGHKEMPKDLLVAADKYQLDLLKKLCEVIIWSYLDESNCIELLIFGHTYHAKILKKGALRSVFINLASLIDTDVYKEFHKQHSELSLEVTRTMIGYEV